MKFIGGFAIFVENNLASQNAKKQAMMSISSTKENYKAVAKATIDMMWIQTLLRKFQVSSPPCAKLSVDNIWCKVVSI